MTRDKVFEVIQNFEANPNESRSTESRQSLRKITSVSLLSATPSECWNSKLHQLKTYFLV